MIIIVVVTVAIFFVVIVVILVVDIVTIRIKASILVSLSSLEVRSLYYLA